MFYQSIEMQGKNSQKTSVPAPPPQLQENNTTPRPSPFQLTSVTEPAAQFYPATGTLTQFHQTPINWTPFQYQPTTQFPDFLPLDVSINDKTTSQTAPTPLSCHQDSKNDVDVPTTPDNLFPYTCDKLSLSPIDQISNRDFQESYSKSPSDSISERSREEDDHFIIDVVNDHIHESVPIADTSKETDTSLANQSSSTSSSSSESSSESSPTASTSEPTTGPLKKSRTNYTPTQVRTLEKVFNENPYPDIDTLEQLSSDLEVAEAKLKIWFQNKRARWRRRAQNSNHAFPQYGMPASSPSMPYSPYGVVAPSPMMAVHAPQQQMPGSSQFYGHPTMTSSPALVTRHNGHNSQLQQPQKPQTQQQQQLSQQQQSSRQQPGSPPVYSQSACSQQQPPSKSPQQGQHPGLLHQQSPPQMYSPVAPSMVSPYSPLTQFSSYVYPYTYGQFPYYR